MLRERHKTSILSRSSHCLGWMDKYDLHPRTNLISALGGVKGDLRSPQSSSARRPPRPPASSRARSPPLAAGTALHHCSALHCTAQHCNAPHCTALHRTVLHCTPRPPCGPPGYLALRPQVGPTHHSRPQVLHLTAPHLTAPQELPVLGRGSGHSAWWMMVGG